MSLDYSRILINHSPLSPRFSSRKWEKKLWNNLLKQLEKENFSIAIKPHPRVGFDELASNIDEEVNPDSYTLLDRLKPSETYYDEYDVLINIFSASSFEALYRGMPVIFIKTEYNNVAIIEELSDNGEIILVDSIEEIPAIIERLNTDEVYRNKIISFGYKAFLRLGGELGVFEEKFLQATKNILDIAR